MKLEGEYAVDKVARAHRIASGVVCAVWILLSFDRHGLGPAFRTAAYYLLPMACIWFPDAMASYTGVIWGMGRYVTERSHPLFIRWAGWFLLLIVPLIFMAIVVLSR
jgi:hypothetical protein